MRAVLPLAGWSSHIFAKASSNAKSLRTSGHEERAAPPKCAKGSPECSSTTSNRSLASRENSPRQRTREHKSMKSCGNLFLSFLRDFAIGGRSGRTDRDDRPVPRCGSGRWHRAPCDEAMQDATAAVPRICCPFDGRCRPPRGWVGSSCSESSCDAGVHRIELAAKVTLRQLTKG